jgi:predicted Zn finger-like uncharacterized protein
MKIVCEACTAKYSISDDKVRGKVFKIRCKKCSHIIVVRGGGGESSGVDVRPEPEPASPAGDASWYVVVEGEQVGPLTAADVAGRISRGEVSGETFAWREGMADWLQVAQLPEFADLASSPSPGQGLAPSGGDDESPFGSPPTAVYPPGAAQNMFAAADSVPRGDGRGEATEVFGAPTAVGAPPAGVDLFAPAATVAAPSPRGAGEPFGGFGPAPVNGGGRTQSSPGGFGDGGFFPSRGAPTPAPPAAMSAAGPGGLTGARSENSVLFSLSNLEALAKPTAGPAMSSNLSGGGGGFGGAGAAVTEGSGLIDIKAMAAMTMSPTSMSGPSSGPSASPFGELPTFSPAPFSPVAPVLLSPKSAGMSKGLVALMSIMGVLTVGALVALVVMAMKPTPQIPGVPPVAVETAPTPAAAVPAAAVEPPETPQPAAKAADPIKDEDLPPRDDARGAVAQQGGQDSKDDKSRRPSSSSGRRDRKPAPAASKEPDEPAAAPPRPAPAPTVAEKPRPAKGSLDDLLAGASNARPTTPTASVAAETTKSLGPLTKTDIVKGMMSVTPKAKACYDRYKVPGTAMTKIKIGASGKVDVATVTGKFAGTPTGDCVETAVKSVKFKPSDSGMQLDYPVAVN